MEEEKENEENSEQDYSDDSDDATEKDTLTDKVRGNPWIASTAVLGVLILVFLIYGFGGITGGAITGGTIGVKDVGENLLNFANSQGANAELIGVDEEGDFYKVILLIDGKEKPILVTKDGSNIVQLIPISEEISDSESQDIKSAEISIDDDAVKGNANAPVTIVEFSDYECPFCGRHFQQTLPQIIEKYVDTGKVKIVFRDFPLSFHEKAQKAAEAAECAGEQNKYWEMHDKLFENQNALEINDLKNYARETGLNALRFEDCLDSGEMSDEVRKDITDGESYGVSGTPANFINGRFVSGAQPFEVFEEIIEEELAKI